ncbi:ATP-dependent nuclease [Paenibacillus camelliae]|uniref:ATP-dependent nuclease n=1 Tax=Paenibacillus camelliae TaxID=512410 RepID=UPI00203F8F59|nr:AAA family ATPase [Paenibacillus camelliae]MCM3635298.1 AAA family ATPase [Paenibacillus camelliae]
MKLVRFSVKNYKVFKDRFSIDFSKDSIVILTGRNNTGKSTILEAINCFFQKETKAKTIPNDCFSVRGIDIVLEAVFETTDDSVTIIKKYKEESTPTFNDDKGVEIKKTHGLFNTLEEILNNKPFYITPSMLPDDINDLIQNIYSEIIKNDLLKLENFNSESNDSKELLELAEEYKNLKAAYPSFLRKIKQNTDSILLKVSNDVSMNLKTLFSNQHLSLNVIGGESSGFSATDLLKSTNSSVHIDSNKQSNMPLSNQGTGLQRMSLIYLIQNMIEKKLLGENENKLLLIDEPEAFLHPEAVRALSRSLYTIGKTMPLMISTHSPILIDLSEKHTSIQVFRVGEKEAIQLYQSVNEQFDEDDIANMKILNYVDSYVNEFFFAEKVVIVEGDTEYIAFKHLSKERGDNIHIIRARGKGTIATLMKILNQFHSSYDVLHDVDNHEKHSATTLKAQLTNCKKILELKKSDNIRVFCSISHFEKAIGLEDISNSNKTKNIYQILHKKEQQGQSKDLFTSALSLIENIYDQIINRNNSTQLKGGFKLISSSEDYEKLFVGLIAQKTEDEEESKKQKV